MAIKIKNIIFKYSEKYVKNKNDSRNNLKFGKIIIYSPTEIKKPKFRTFLI